LCFLLLQHTLKVRLLKEKVASQDVQGSFNIFRLVLMAFSGEGGGDGRREEEREGG